MPVLYVRINVYVYLEIKLPVWEVSVPFYEQQLQRLKDPTGRKAGHKGYPH